MSASKKIKEFFYSLRASDKYSDYDSRKSFNRVNKPGAETSLLSHHQNSSTLSFAGEAIAYEVEDGVHEMRLAWRHIKKWLHRHSSDLNESLLLPCTEADMNEFQKDLGVRLPRSVVEFFLLTDGQSNFNDNGSGGLVYGLKLLSIDQIAVLTENWRKVYRSIDTDAAVRGLPQQYSVPPGSILPVYAHELWIPIITDSAGNSIAIDLLPQTPDGSDRGAENEIQDANRAVWGQVIIFGRDFDAKFKIADNFGDFLLIFANDLEKGNWDLKTTLENQDMVCGVDTELVYVDHETKKEVPYLDVLRRRCVEKWVDSLTAEERRLPKNVELIEHLRASFSYHVPTLHERATDDFINENLNGIDIGEASGDPVPAPAAEGSKTAVEEDLGAKNVTGILEKVGSTAPVGASDDANADKDGLDDMVEEDLLN